MKESSKKGIGAPFYIPYIRPATEEELMELQHKNIDIHKLPQIKANDPIIKLYNTNNPLHIIGVNTVIYWGPSPEETYLNTPRIVTAPLK